jgi:hypothetical protein
LGTSEVFINSYNEVIVSTNATCLFSPWTYHI